MSELDPGFTTSESRRLFSRENRLLKMLDVEAALARATAEAGLIPAAAAETIVDACRTEHFDAAVVFADGWEVGTPVLPLVARLREIVGAELAPHVHRGATTQDVIDTGLVLQMREAFDVLEGDALWTGRKLVSLAEQERDTPILGRTLLQPAAAVTFGLKAASWLDAVTRDLERFQERSRRLALQFGGPVGHLAGLEGHGLEIAEAMGRDLDLEVPALPWHASRDRIAEIAAVLVVFCASVQKIAGDLVLLAQGEVAEITVRPGASSAMPHKRNPIDAIRAIAAARFAVGQGSVLLGASASEHERAAGAWHAEWAAVPTLFHAALAASEALGRALGSLEVDRARMNVNLELLGPGPHDTGLAGELVDRVLTVFRKVTA